MSLSRQEADKAAANQRARAKSLRTEAAKKGVEARQLEEKIKSLEKGTRLMGLGGPVIRAIGASRRHSSSKLEQQAKQLKQEEARLVNQAKAAEKEANSWDIKAKAAKE